jgi:hypothetical protein
MGTVQRNGNNPTGERAFRSLRQDPDFGLDLNKNNLGVRSKSPVLFKMKIPYDSLVAIRTALQLRLEDLEKRIQNAERNKDQVNLDFWTERHQALVTAIKDLEEVL